MGCHSTTLYTDIPIPTTLSEIEDMAAHRNDSNMTYVSLNAGILSFFYCKKSSLFNIFIQPSIFEDVAAPRNNSNMTYASDQNIITRTLVDSIIKALPKLTILIWWMSLRITDLNLGRQSKETTKTLKKSHYPKKTLSSSLCSFSLYSFIFFWQWLW